MIKPPALAKALETGFDLDELETLCFQVGIRFDNLPGETLEAKARAAVQYSEKRGMVDALIVAAMNERPNMFWDDAAEGVSAETLRFMVPTLTSGTKRLMGMQMARIEGRQNAQATCLRQTKTWLGVVGATNGVTLILVLLLLIKGLA